MIPQPTPLASDFDGIGMNDEEELKKLGLQGYGETLIDMSADFEDLGIDN